MKRVDLVGLAVETTGGAPVVVLREQDEPHRILPIFIGGAELGSIAVAVSGEELPRPLTHDLLVGVLHALGARLEAVEVTGNDNGTFVASLRIGGPAGEQWLDARPSDALALALRTGSPVLVSEQVLDEAGSVPTLVAGEATVGQGLNEREIDAQVEEFRSFLDQVDPGAFRAS